MQLDKPAGPTSHDVVAMVRRAFHTRRVGHAGTLDPFATGLLLVLVGQATRLARYLVGLPKEYHGVLRLGVRTTTDDATGDATATSDAWQSVGDERLRAAMTSLLGEREQVPPAYSAKHLGGERAHRLARRGESVALAPHRVEIRRFDLLARNGPDVQFAAAVGSGAYLRALARELGDALSCGAHLVELRRTSVGPFQVEGAATVEDLRQGRATLAPPAAALGHLAAARVDATAVQRLTRGQPIEASEASPGPVALLCDGRLVCGCADPYGRRPLGDARSSSVHDVWTGDRIRRLREDLNGGGSTFCGDCPLKLPLKKDEAPPVRPLDWAPLAGLIAAIVAGWRVARRRRT